MTTLLVFLSYFHGLQMWARWRVYHNALLKAAHANESLGSAIDIRNACKSVLLFCNEIAWGWGPAESVRLFAQRAWGPRFNLHCYWRNTGYTIFSSQRLHNWPSCWADLQSSSWNLSNLAWPNTMLVLKSSTLAGSRPQDFAPSDLSS